MAGLQAYLSVLAKWKGYNEADGTDDIIINIYNAHRERDYKPALNEPWCQMTVSAAAYESGNFPGILPNEAYCPFAVDWFKQRGQWKSYRERPVVGDIVYYDWSGTRTKLSGHVGTVIQVNSTTMVVREGNYQDALKDRNIELSSPFILGYGTVKWPATPTVVEPAPEPVKPESTKPGTIVITGDTYTVKAGDNLYRIAHAAGVSEEDLCKWNGLADKNLIFVDQVIKLKAPNPFPEQPEKLVVTTEKKDDWVLRLQKELNRQRNAGLVEDGIAGPRTLGACCTVGYTAKGNLTKLIQEKLGGLTIDGEFGPATRNAVIGFQEKHNLNVTGRVDNATWRVLLGLEY